MRLDPFVVDAVVVSEESGHYWLPNSSDQVAMADDRHEPHNSGGPKRICIWRGSGAGPCGPHNRTVRTRYIMARDIKPGGGPPISSRRTPWQPSVGQALADLAIWPRVATHYSP
jgi:hypothetical protein